MPRVPGGVLWSVPGLTAANCGVLSVAPAADGGLLESASVTPKSNGFFADSTASSGALAETVFATSEAGVADAVYMAGEGDDISARLFVGDDVLSCCARLFVGNATLTRS
jgi:hypothetical protein